MVDRSFAERHSADLYGHILLEALGGPWASHIKRELGPAFAEVCRVLLVRQERRLWSDPVDLAADDIDWAAVRALAPLMLARYDDEFHATTGHDLDELRELGKLAVDARREYQEPRNAISYAIGDCEVVMPTAYLEDRSKVAAVPDASSWNAVAPECARDRRDEFLDPMRSRFKALGAHRAVIEVPVGSIDELQAWVNAHRRRKAAASRPPK